MQPPFYFFRVVRHLSPLLGKVQVDLTNLLVYYPARCAFALFGAFPAIRSARSHITFNPRCLRVKNSGQKWRRLTGAAWCEAVETFPPRVEIQAD
jgi:hypothetical protein